LSSQGKNKQKKMKEKYKNKLYEKRFTGLFLKKDIV
jgi:hypothetical protein